MPAAVLLSASLVALLKAVLYYLLSYGLIAFGLLWLWMIWIVHKNTSGIVSVKDGSPIPSVSFLGSLVSYISEALKEDGDMIGCYLQMKERLGSCFILWQGWICFVVISEPEDLKQVLLCNQDPYARHDVFASHAILKRIFGTSLVGVGGDQWKKQRRGMEPAFAFKKLKGLMSTFNIGAQRLITYWEDKLAAAPDQPIPAAIGVSNMTLDVLGMALFSYDFKALEEKFNESIRAYETIRAMMLNPLYILFPWLAKLPLPTTIRLNRAFADMDALLFKILDEHIKQEEEGKADKDLLAHVLALRGSLMSDQEVRDNLFMFFIAGHDTSSSALISALYFMGLYPDIQKRAQEEVDAVLDGRTEVEYDDLRKLEYVGRVLKETLRVKPPVDATTSRTVTRDGIVLGGYHLPKGTQVVPSISLANYDEKAWPEPHKFDPDRWEHPSADAISFLSFSAGPRVCIGKNFAMMEMTVALSRILQRFEVSLIPNYEWKTKLVSIAHTPLDNLPLLFKLRS